ncbi:glycosyltransferase family 9 protein [Desulfatiglans anilini]|uniref:glycosyltransferase family 9 protein n=1 Tax=Desulfatiglans anilini TaxID=90728 RepID=UPI0003F55D05|nr:glycosyltransferase family 9 protein [Desulfatiglans anilini]
MEIRIKSFNGIGDLLFLTPTLRRIKETCPGARVVVNTNHPAILAASPFVDGINEGRDGVFLGYPDPIHRVLPTRHHILSDWEIVSKAYGLELEPPELKPEIYLAGGWEREVWRSRVGVQVRHKGHWWNKKVWPGFLELSGMPGFEPIPRCQTVADLVRVVGSYRAVVCAEGGLSHIARALGVPAVVVFGGFADPAWNGYEEQVNICNPLPCSYCYNPDPCVDFLERRCMKEITVAQVAAAAQEAAERGAR